MTFEEWLEGYRKESGLDWYAEMKAARSAWDTANGQNRAEVARLRKALQAWLGFMGQPPVDKYTHDSQWEDAWRLSQAALSDTADDWLERHDAEVRAQERGHVFRTVNQILETFLPPEDARWLKQK